MTQYQIIGIDRELNRCCAIKERMQGEGRSSFGLSKRRRFCRSQLIAALKNTSSERRILVETDFLMGH